MNRRLLILLALLSCAVLPIVPGSVTAEETEASRTIDDAHEQPEIVESDEEDASTSFETSDDGSSLWGDVEEFVVYGTASSADLLEATVSVLGFDADTLLKEGINDIADIAAHTPNLEIKSVGASNPTLFIRGVGLDDFNANSSSSVAVYQDDVYMNSPAGQLFQFFDIAEVNVLRGPQGSLYRHASAGVIQVISQKPTDDFQVWGTATYGKYNAANIQAAISGPIVEERLLGRAAFWWGQRDGITKNRCGGLPVGVDTRDTRCAPDSVARGALDVTPGLEKSVNNKNAWAARGQLLVRVPIPGSPVESEWLLKVHGARNLALTTQYQHRGVQFLPRQNGQDFATGFLERTDGSLATDRAFYRDQDGDAFAGDYGNVGDEDLDLWGSHLVGTAEIGGIQIKSITGYEAHDRSVLSNDSAGPTPLLIDTFSDDAWQISQEFRLNGDFGERWSFGEGGVWTAGGIFFREDLNAGGVFTSSQSPVIDLVQDFSQETTSFALYGHIKWDFLEDFTLEGGGRYNWVQKVFAIEAYGLSKISGQRLNNLPLQEEKAIFDDVSGEVSLTYHFDEANSIYVKFSRGWKPGHFNGGALFSTQLIEPVSPEIIDSFEAGLRLSFLDDRLNINLTGFYYDYTDLQIFRLEQDSRGFAIQQLVNAESARVLGFEADLILRPFEGLKLQYNFGYLDTEYVDFSTGFPQRQQVPCPPGDPRIRCFDIVDVFIDYSGSSLIAAPQFRVNGSAEYEFELPKELGSLTPRFSFSWKDEIFFDTSEGRGQLRNLPRGTLSQPSHWVMNTSLTWRSPQGDFDLQGWVRNLGDEEIRVQSFDLNRGFGVILDSYADPLTWGISVTARY